MQRLSAYSSTVSVLAPYYQYDLGILEDTLKAINRCTADRKDWHVHYAIKANANPMLLKLIRKHGLGIDCVSGGEIRVALENGFDASTIVFAGVGKAEWEIDLSLEAGIACFNVESKPSGVISERCALLNKTNIALRVIPMSMPTHRDHHWRPNKFGIEIPCSCHVQSQGNPHLIL